MRKLQAILVIVVVTAGGCGQSEGMEGPEGPQGPQGTQGPQGPAGATPDASAEAGTTVSLKGLTLWKDTSGTIMPVLGPTQTLLYPVYFFADTTGVLWVVDIGLQTPTIAATTAASIGYTTSNCTGTEYVLTPPAPRYTFVIATNTLGTQAYVSPDNVVPAFMAIQSTQGSSCSGAAAQMAVPLTSMVKVTAPTTPPGIPPYHPEIQ